MCNHEGHKFSPRAKCHAGNTKVNGLLTQQPCATPWYSRQHDWGPIMLPKPQLQHEILSPASLSFKTSEGQLATQRDKMERNSKRGGSFLENVFTSVFLFFLFFSLFLSYTWFHSQTLLTQRMNFRSPHLCVWWGRKGQVFLSWTQRVSCQAGPRRGGGNSVFEGKIIVRDTSRPRSACWICN